MVKKRKNMIRRNLLRSIKSSLGRYLAIVGIVALGAGVFCGLRVTKVDMVATVQDYTDKQNMFDLQVMNTYGWTDKEVGALAQTPGIANAEGGISMDVLMHYGGGEDHAYKLIGIPEQVNKISLDAGRLPEAPDECLADSYLFDERFLGTRVEISRHNEEDTLDSLACEGYTVVGLTSTPLYLNMQRGSTTIGRGSLDTYFYVPMDSFDLDVYTQIDLTLEGEYAVYTDEYDDAMDAMAEQMETTAQALADQRREDVLRDAKEEYNKGYQELLDGVAEFEDGRQEALDQIAQAEQELADGEKELEENRQTLADGRQQLYDAQMTVNENRAELEDSKRVLQEEMDKAYAQLDEAKAELDANEQDVTSGLQQVNDGLAQIEDGLVQMDEGLAQIDSGIAQIEDALVQLNDGLAQLDAMLPLLDAAAELAQEALDAMNALPMPDSEALAELEAQLEALIAQREEYTRQREELIATRDLLNAQLEELNAQKEALLVQREEALAMQQELLATKATLEEAMTALAEGRAQLEAGYAEADAQFADAKAQIADGERQLYDAQRQLDEQWIALEEGEQALADGEQELLDGRAEFETEKADALREIDEAEADLNEAAAELADARAELDDMDPAQLYALTRNTNLGYVVFESDSDIVDGVAEIFPIFFLAVAALVCITTMTRMIDEERTQIGVLKALGYSSGAIMSKYLGYSGTASLLGCGIGVALGCTVFPTIIWNAYCIMYNFSDQLTLSYDLGTIAFILVSYTGLTMLVTWYCCRRELKEVPAELIRPKAPAAGKQLWLEKLPVWKHLSFLNKVATRNIFRYKQRLAMMLLGIGGCTALLITGFGLGDSISGLSTYQFEDVMVHDIAVTFEDPLDQAGQEAFLAQIDGAAEQVLFCYQSSVDLDSGDGIKNVNFLASDEDLRGFIDLHDGDASIPMPGDGEAVVSICAATSLDLAIGDTVTLRNADLEELTVTVSGIFDNNVYNYAIVNGQTLRQQWGREPELQTAFVVTAPEQDVHQAGAVIADADGVLNVTINADTAEQVGGMMDALDAVIVLIVVCAGLLAGIVLYNLTNINIKERLREIATIKVLGFHAGETAGYVFKENLALTVMGTILGLGGGKLLHAVVMSYIRIDMVWFDNLITPTSYAVAAALTLLSAIIVDFIMYFQLEKINMAEALKSVE